MKNRKKLRIAAVLLAGLGLIGCGVLSFLVAPQVDDDAGALLGQGVVVTQGLLLRILGVAEIAAGLFALIRPRTPAGFTAALVAAVALSLSPRFGTATTLDVAGLGIDARIVLATLQVIGVVAGLAIILFWMIRPKRTTGTATS